MTVVNKIRNKCGTWSVAYMCIVAAAFIWSGKADELATCQPKDFHYELTECDESGGRWRVSVPKPDTCVGGAPNAPERIHDCTTSCPEGKFFDKQKLTCYNCPAGSYSLGGGLRINNWTTLPQGFHITTEQVRSSFRQKKTSNTDENNTCTQYGWQLRGAYIVSLGGPCVSSLSFSVKLVKAGVLRYEYQYTDDLVIFNFEAQNDQCQTVESSQQTKWPSTTEDKWKTSIVNLQAGLNVLDWRTVGMDTGEGKSQKPVKIRNIEISGIAYTSECTPCEAGTYSATEAASECAPCPMNTFSNAGAQNCQSCSPNQYAYPGSSSCLPRPPCTKNDYFETHSACGADNKTRLEYSWVQPVICDMESPQSAKLPVSGRLIDCPKCNPGMEHSSDKSMCKYCPPGAFSDGIVKTCSKCPPSTTPDYGFFLKRWFELPPNMKTRCLSPDKNNDCRDHTAWTLDGDFVQSGNAQGADVYSLLSLEVGSFRGEEVVIGGRGMSYGTVLFTFEMNCVGNCEMVFMSARASELKGVSIIKTWIGPQSKQSFRHLITINDSYSFSWAFQKSEPQIPGQPVGDYARIYDITVTNTVQGGAQRCLSCPIGSEDKGCMPCGPGQYIKDKQTLECKNCPPNTYIGVRGPPFGAESCHPCGLGLRNEGGQRCYSDCTVFLGSGDEFDFSRLPPFLEVKGRKLFTAAGVKHYHMFNISLCNGNGGKRPIAVCTNNVTLTSEELALGDRVAAHICRSTIVPERGDSFDPLAIQSVSMGDELIGITTRPSLNNITVIKEFLPGDNEKPDIHFFYYSPAPTQACLEGRATTITMHCDKNAGINGTVSLPTSCPDGTCDGCTFHFLWKTQLACRVCAADDYQVVKGECVAGVQNLHYISPKNCIPRGGGGDTLTRQQTCSVIPRQLQIAIAVGVGFSMLLIGLVVYFWKKNQKLEYKYMKLVASNSGKDGCVELPAAETCGLDEDEEEAQDGATSGKKSGLLDKFRTGVRMGNKYDTLNNTSMREGIQQRSAVEWQGTPI